MRRFLALFLLTMNFAAQGSEQTTWIVDTSVSTARTEPDQFTRSTAWSTSILRRLGDLPLAVGLSGTYETLSDEKTGDVGGDYYEHSFHSSVALDIKAWLPYRAYGFGTYGRLQSLMFSHYSLDHSGPFHDASHHTKERGSLSGWASSIGISYLHQNRFDLFSELTFNNHRVVTRNDNKYFEPEWRENSFTWFRRTASRGVSVAFGIGVHI